MLGNNSTHQLHRKNNFDFLRLLLASSVIITHSYSLSGIPEHDWLWQLTNGQALMSHVGVKGFFVLSGYLIFQSLERASTVSDFFWKRSLRLFPALLVMLVLTLLVVPFVYASDVPLLANRSFWTYLPNNLVLYKTQYVIKGVFENNPYKGAINGSLWTIPYEFTLYVLIALLFPIKRQRKVVGFLLCTLFLLLLIGNVYFFADFSDYNYILRAQSMLDLSIFFVAGAIIARFNIAQKEYRKKLLIVASLLFILSLYLNIFNNAKYILLPIIIILFGQSSTPIIRGIGKKVGDLSYGIYIYGFLVQQLLVHFFKLDYSMLMLWSIPITFGLAYLSWHLVEKRALKLKKSRPVIVGPQLVAA